MVDNGTCIDSNLLIYKNVNAISFLDNKRFNIFDGCAPREHHLTFAIITLLQFYTFCVTSQSLQNTLARRAYNQKASIIIIPAGSLIFSFSDGKKKSVPASRTRVVAVEERGDEGGPAVCNCNLWSRQGWIRGSVDPAYKKWALISGARAARIAASRN